jgi:hypothetical protein
VLTVATWLDSAADLGQAAAAVASFIALVAIWIQIRRQKEAEQAAVYQAISQQMFDIDRVFLEYPHLRPYFYDGVDASECTGDDRGRLDTIAEMFLDFIDNVQAQSDRFDANLRDFWSTFFGSLGENAPILAETELRCCDWYPKEVWDALGLPRASDQSREAA